MLLGDQLALAPEETFYQRILAGDPDEAAHQAEVFLKEKSLCDYYDEIAMKVLALAQLDARRGALNHERRVEIKQTIEGLIDNLSDHEDAPGARDSASDEKSSEGKAAPPKATVLCVTGGGPLDEAAAAMLAQDLLKRGVGARVVPNHEISSGNIFRLDRWFDGGQLRSHVAGTGCEGSRKSRASVIDLNLRRSEPLLPHCVRY